MVFDKMCIMMGNDKIDTFDFMTRWGGEKKKKEKNVSDVLDVLNEGHRKDR